MRNCLGTSELSTTRDRVGLNLTLSQEQLAEGESSMGFAEVFVTVLIEWKPVCALIFPASGRLESRSTLISALRRGGIQCFPLEGCSRALWRCLLGGWDSSWLGACRTLGWGAAGGWLQGSHPPAGSRRCGGFLQLRLGAETAASKSRVLSV